MSTGINDPDRPPLKINMGGWVFDHHFLTPDSYPAVERYVLVGAHGSRACADLQHDGTWRARLYPAISSPNRRLFIPGDAFATVTDALAAVVREMHDRGYLASGDDFELVAFTDTDTDTEEGQS